MKHPLNLKKPDIMSKNLLNRYIWFVDIIKRYGKISRDQLNKEWEQSPYSDGQPMPRRTFYNYRNSIEDLFGINIECSPSTYEYYIADNDTHGENLTNWMLNSAAMNNVITDAREVAGRIFLEDVPSARTYLSTVIKALKDFHPVIFTYHAFNRSNPTTDVTVEPYFLKIFRQRWYLTGRNVKDDKIKTYALDRIHDLVVHSSTFELPASFDVEEYTRDSFGIIFSQSEVKDVAIKCDVSQARYLRALPLHPSQHEAVHDSYSIFYYKLRLTHDFVQEILSFGPRLTVLSPPELRAMVVDDLNRTLDNYRSKKRRRQR